MAVSYTFQGSIVRMDLVGVYSPQDIIDTFDKALADPDCPDDARLLLDVTRSDSLAERSVDDLRRVAEYYGQRAERTARRCAILARSDVHFGLMRMAVVFIEAYDSEARVFKVEDEAVQWLMRSLTGARD
jgi:hypothetical protein